MLSLRNIWTLCRKELVSLLRDRVLFVFMLYAFSLMVYSQATGVSHDLVRASVGIVDEDRSALSQQIADAFLPPRFQKPVALAADAVDEAMDQARYTFVLDIPPDFQADILAGRRPVLQVLIDATAMMQAGIGSNYIQSIISDEVGRFLRREGKAEADAVSVQVRIAFNQSLNSVWFSGTMALIEVINMLGILLAGAALIRERERGTLEHLLVMPVRAAEIMLAKILANGGIILALSLVSMYGVVRMLLGMPVAGSLWLFLASSVIYLFFATSLGIFLATIARSMAQFALLFMLILMPMTMLSGALTPIEAMPQWLHAAVQFLPTKHYVAVAQAVLMRGAGLDVVWPALAAILAIGASFFAFSLIRFRSFLAQQQ
ncbi:ABC transporter permease [uncultured Ferrovibrio sp.]|jgi:ABC-2 type transport system permease protein|uniref:ABC transporter permease n=1 Tax=uncultured Ferrovibrio sp. TaxID=1576913 RepID=UPI0026075563|nr:ABC transporter permease [uncultured Ferrovibrio sp.]